MNRFSGAAPNETPERRTASPWGTPRGRFEFQRSKDHVRSSARHKGWPRKRKRRRPARNFPARVFSTVPARAELPRPLQSRARRPSVMLDCQHRRARPSRMQLAAVVPIPESMQGTSQPAPVSRRIFSRRSVRRDESATLIPTARSLLTNFVRDTIVDRPIRCPQPADRAPTRRASVAEAGPSHGRRYARHGSVASVFPEGPELVSISKAERRAATSNERMTRLGRSRARKNSGCRTPRVLGSCTGTWDFFAAAKPYESTKSGLPSQETAISRDFHRASELTEFPRARRMHAAAVAAIRKRPSPEARAYTERLRPSQVRTCAARRSWKITRMPTGVDHRARVLRPYMALRIASPERPWRLPQESSWPTHCLARC